jgi:hypothetical protein
MSRTTSPCRASDGAVRKNRPLSSAVDSAGEVADAGRVAAHAGHGRAVEQLARVRHFLHREFRGGAHRRRDRFQRAGEAQNHTDLDVLGRGGPGDKRRGAGQKQFLHFLVSLSGQVSTCRKP